MKRPFFSRTLCRKGLAMTERRQGRRSAIIRPYVWSIFVLAVTVGCLGAIKGQSEMRDVEFIQEHSQPYMAKALQDLEKFKRDLRQNNGDRSNNLVRVAKLFATLGELAETEERLDYYEKGRDYAEMMVREHPGWADGHYWLAVNLCGVAEVGGAGRALRLLPEIVEHLERAAAIDPTYDQAGAHRILGRIYSEAPAWPLSVGDIFKSLHHLKLAVKIAPENSTNHLFLADTLMHLGKKKEAQAELDKVFKSTKHATWPLGVEQDRREARRLLARWNSQQ
jgi:tetratricopeptide (TPR) repeat protein